MFNESVSERLALGTVYALQSFAALLCVGLLWEAMYWGVQP